MRCQTCGFQNNAESVMCVKCNTRLNAQPAVPAGFSHQPATQAAHPGGIPTIKGANPLAMAATATVFTCEQCGHYPLAAEVSAAMPCPNCNFKGKAAPQHHTIKIGGLFMGQGPASSKVRLTDVLTSKVIEFDGEDLTLNREQINPADMSISSGKHVQFTKQKGHWYVTDHSTNQATFLQVNGQVPVQSDSHIIIGNRVYKIELDQ